MKNKIGFIKWVLNYNYYSTDYQNLLDEVDIIRKDYDRKNKKNKKQIENLINIVSAKENRILTLEKAVKERNIEIQELHKELAELKVKEIK